jgi:hypothetical protein
VTEKIFRKIFQGLKILEGRIFWKILLGATQKGRPTWTPLGSVDA